jgi:hypothetical protein
MRPYVIRPPTLAHDEALVWTTGASRVGPGGTGRIVGGRVFLTTHRLVHRPAYIERLIRTQEWACSLDDVVDVEVGPRFTSLIGALGQLVPVNLTGGRIVMFRVWNGSRFAARVTAAKAERHPSG